MDKTRSWMDGWTEPWGRRFIAHGQKSNSQDAQNTLFGKTQIQDTVEKLGTGLD